MPILLLALGLGVLAYLWWRRATTTLTRECRWRMNRAAGHWRCVACGAQQAGLDTPRDCLRDQGAGHDV